ncbi:MAG: SusD/RagB family nutrient-binding outer membrane lipoprotein [Candidatus Marinimicrobia bacterium]|nr:SusD/RagB family nutrient-binding outer membrane lipoprotein [Candidatus Neomarinimicrobiota bacterium]
MRNSTKGLRSMKNIFSLILVGSMLMLTSCEIPTDLNDNPNEITLQDADAILFLNGAQLANIMVQNSHLNRISGMFSGQLVGYTSLYSNIYGYSLSTVESNDEWNGCYTGVLTNVRHIREIVPDDKLLVGIAKVLEAHAVGTLAILMGDVPYSEVVSEVEDPVFDSQVSVLDALTSLLDDAISDLGSTSGRPEDYDIYYNGDKDKWLAAAYTLKARYALIQSDYTSALTAANMGISSSADDMNFIPRGEAEISEGDKNLFNAILSGSRTGDIGNNGSYLLELLNDSTANYRGNDKTNETARHNYYKIDETSGEGNLGVIERFEPMPMVTYFENQMIKAEAAARTTGFSSGLSHLNDYRAWLTSGGRLNATFNDSASILYEAYVDADFASGGMENPDGVSAETALLREIIQERYVSGFGTYMPFNDHRRLRGDGETDLIPPFPLNTTAATDHVERIPYAQDELSSNSTMDNDPGLYVKTEVNQ